MAIYNNIHNRASNYNKISESKSLFPLILVGVLAPALAWGQNVRDYIVDPNPVFAPLEKTIGYYTSTTLPSVAIGRLLDRAMSFRRLV